MKHSLDKKWLVAQIKPNSYDLAFRNLKRQGFATFLPKMKITTRKEKRFIYKDVLVFPGYMFVGVDPQDFNWTRINSTYGVSKLLSYSDKPAEISRDLIITLKNRYQKDVHSSRKETLQKGDNIKFNSGPFVDLIAGIEALDGKNRIWVLLEAMGQKMKVKIQKTEKIKFYKV
tara:strand:- start:1144 stop:1662 length:519 start_codon:yes stop_codon:yes gene_type:complete